MKRKNTTKSLLKMLLSSMKLYFFPWLGTEAKLKKIEEDAKVLARPIVEPRNHYHFDDEFFGPECVNNPGSLSCPKCKKRILKPKVGLYTCGICHNMCIVTESDLDVTKDQSLCF